MTRDAEIMTGDPYWLILGLAPLACHLTGAEAGGTLGRDIISVPCDQVTNSMQQKYKGKYFGLNSFIHHPIHSPTLLLSPSVFHC